MEKLVVDVWESGEELEQNFGTPDPILVRNGPPPPQPEVYPVHNVVL